MKSKVAALAFFATLLLTTFLAFSQIQSAKYKTTRMKQQAHNSLDVNQIEDQRIRPTVLP